MSASLHLNLLKEEERYSSSPVRLRVMLPLIASFITLCLLVWWALLCFNAHGQSQFKKELQKAIASLDPAYDAVLESRAQAQESRAIIGQLTLYKNARNLFGETFSALAERVPETVQFTEVRIPPPQPPIADPRNPATVAPTNVFEQVTMRISGRTGGNHPSEGVNGLLATLYTPAFTNLFRSAAIPKGAFRQDGAKNSANRETLLFEITCECAPRRFQ